MSYSHVTRDPVKAFILERKVYNRKTNADLAAVIGVSPRTFSRMIHGQHTDEWQLKHIRLLCWYLNITEEQFAAILANKRR